MSHNADIPQPRPVPVLGNLPDIDTSAPVQSMMRLAQAYGPIYRLSVGGRTVTILSSQELVDEVCDEARFAKKVHKPLEMIRDLPATACSRPTTRSRTGPRPTAC